MTTPPQFRQIGMPFQCGVPHYAPLAAFRREDLWRAGADLLAAGRRPTAMRDVQSLHLHSLGA